MSQTPDSILSPRPTVHCINPDCPNPSHQPWGNNFCQNCGSPLKLNQRYIPLKLLGRGGFATIYTVWDEQDQVEKVLKVLMETSAKALELFTQEATVLASLRHPGIPIVEKDGYFAVETRNFSVFKRQIPARQLACLVMEKINGKTLQEILSNYPQGCPNELVINWFLQALDILEVLHQRNIIHRDLKPSNLMLKMPINVGALPVNQNDLIMWGQLVAIDFGGAKQINTNTPNASSTRLFSPGYSPPEQLVGSGVGPGTDFYALGRTFIHLLTGHYPADLENEMNGQLHWRHLTTIKKDLADLIDEIIAPHIEQRPASVAEIKEILQKGRGTTTQPTQIVQNSPNSLKIIMIGISRILDRTGQLTLDTIRLILYAILALVHTIWGIVLGAASGISGVIIGLLLVNHQALYYNFSNLIYQTFLAFNLTRSDTDIKLIASAILGFGGAGMGTGMGFKLAGGFGPNGIGIVAGLSGGLSYIIGWLFWFIAREIHADNIGSNGLISLAAIASGLLALNLGWHKYSLVYALVVADGVVFMLILGGVFFPDLFLNLIDLPQKDIMQNFGLFIGFFSLLGALIGLCLGISHYLIIPLLKWLGWR